MGGEMMYVLEQRLEAQKIAKDKSERVMQDVISALFAPRFIDELFRPEKTYSSTVTRQIFDRLAHSSIMRLNTNSMDKLYDLMTMGTKYQILAASHPYDMLQATLTHIDNVTKMVEGSAEIVRLIENTRQRLISVFATHSLGQLQLIRQNLLRFFLDRRVKVSVLLQDGKQLQSGAFNLNNYGTAPIGSEPAGTIRYFALPQLPHESLNLLAGKERVVTLNDSPQVPLPKVLRTEVISNLPNAAEVLPYPEEPKINILARDRPSKLGSNMYASTHSDGSSARRASDSKSGASRGSVSSAVPETEEKTISTKLFVRELNSLAAMLGTSRASSGLHAKAIDEDEFNRQAEADRAAMEAGSANAGAGVLNAVTQLTQESEKAASKHGLGSFLLSNLFDLDGDDVADDGFTTQQGLGVSANTVVVKNQDARQMYAELAKSVTLTSAPEATTQDSEEVVDDLLALMDMAVAEDSNQ